MDNCPVAPEEARRIAGLFHDFMRHLTMGNDGEGDDAAKEMPLAQLRVCHVLCGGPRSMSAISREMGTSLSAVTQIADRLERAELIRRVSGGDDRRIRCLQLSQRGEQIMRFHEESRIRRMSRVLERLTPDEREEAASAFRMLAQAAREAKGCNEGASDGPHRLITSKAVF
jgi:DNA-binding MarR family transcriptional regulator